MATALRRISQVEILGVEMENTVILAVTAERVRWNDRYSNDPLRVSNAFIRASRASGVYVPRRVFFTQFGFVLNRSETPYHRWVMRTYREASGGAYSVGFCVADTAELMLRGVKIENAILLMAHTSFSGFKTAGEMMGVRLYHHHYDGELAECG